MPIRMFLAGLVLVWRVSAYCQNPSGLHYGLMVAQIAIFLALVGVTLGGYARCRARYR